MIFVQQARKMLFKDKVTPLKKPKKAKAIESYCALIQGYMTRSEHT